MPMVPKIHFPVVDVRDVARAHINAMTVPEAAGNRHLLAPDEGWFKDMAKVCVLSNVTSILNYFIFLQKKWRTRPTVVKSLLKIYRTWMYPTKHNCFIVIKRLTTNSGIENNISVGTWWGIWTTGIQSSDQGSTKLHHPFEWIIRRNCSYDLSWIRKSKMVQCSCCDIFKKI